MTATSFTLHLASGLAEPADERKVLCPHAPPRPLANALSTLTYVTASVGSFCYTQVGPDPLV